MNFRKTAVAITAAAALAAGTFGAANQAAATPAWVVPTIIAVGVGGLALGATTGHSHAYVAAPAARCWVENRRGGPVEVCRR